MPRKVDNLRSRQRTLILPDTRPKPSESHIKAIAGQLICKRCAGAELKFVCSRHFNYTTRAFYCFDKSSRSILRALLSILYRRSILLWKDYDHDNFKSELVFIEGSGRRGEMTIQDYRDQVIKPIIMPLFSPERPTRNGISEFIECEALPHDKGELLNFKKTPTHPPAR